MKKLLNKQIAFEFEVASNVSGRTLLRRFNEYTGWKAKQDHDPSIEHHPMKYGVEIKTPPVPYSQGIAKLKKAFKFFQNEEVITNYSTGLHVNMSFNNSGYNFDLDAKKLQVLIDDLKWLKKFDRTENEYCESPKFSISEMIAGYNKRSWNIDKFIKKLEDEFADDDSELNAKYCAVNIGKLQCKKPYVEFRCLGGENYHWKVNDVIRACLDFSKTMDMSLGSRYDYLVKRYITNMAGFAQVSTPTIIPH